mgnify:CR=1 FL=1
MNWGCHINILNWLVICTVSFALPLFPVGANEPSNSEDRLDSVVRKQFSRQQGTNLQLAQISTTEKKLKRRIDLIFFDTALSEVLDSLGTKLDVQFYIDKRALTEVGLDSNTTINFNLRNVKAELALGLMLKQRQLVWFVRNNLVHVTTPEFAAYELEIRIYRCHDFLEIPSHPPGRRGMDGGISDGGAGTSEFRNRQKTLSDLVELIPSVIDPTSWEDLGGTGSIGTLPDGILVIAQTRSVHAEVQHLLQAMRMQRKGIPNAANKPADLISTTEQKLEQQIDAFFMDVPLKDLLESLGTKLDVQFYVDERALNSIGIDSNTPVNFSLRKVKAELALRMIMNEIGLVSFVQQDLVHVTTPEAAENLQVLGVYSCPDLLETTGRPPHHNHGNRIQRGFPGGRGDTTAPYRDQGPDSLIEVIQTKISQDSWEQVGGAGVIVNYYEILVVSQIPPVHREVEEMLNGLRTANKSKSGAIIRLR